MGWDVTIKKGVVGGCVSKVTKEGIADEQRCVRIGGKVACVSAASFFFFFLSKL